MSILVYNTTFAHGVLSAQGGGLFSSIVGSPTIPGPPYNYLRATYAAGGNYISKTLAASNAVLVGRFYVYFEALATGDSHIYFSINVATGNSLSLFFYPPGPPSNVLGGYNVEMDFKGDSYAQVTTGQKYRIDFKIDGTNKTFDWQVDGHVQTQRTFTTAATYNGFGAGAWSGGDNQIVRISDIALSQTAGDYPIGAGQGIGLSPNGPGTSNPGTGVIQDNASVDVNDATNPANIELDDVPISINTDYIKQVAVGTGNYFEVDFADLSGASAVNGAIAILAYMSSGTSTNQGGCIVSRNGAFSPYDEIWGNPTTRADYSESSMFYKAKQLSTPSGGWSQSAVNALKVRGGYSNDISPVPYWENLIIEVDYVPVTGNTYNEAPANSFSSSPACAPSTFLAISPSLAAFVSSPALARTASADLLGSVGLTSTPSLSRVGAVDFFTSLSLPSSPAVSIAGGMDLFNSIAFLSGPAAAMAYNLDIFKTLTLASNPALSPSALADFLSSLTLVSTPAAVMAAIATLYASRTLASSPAWTAIGGSDFYNSVAFSSAPALSEAAFKNAFGELSLLSNPAFTAQNIASLLAAISLSSNPALQAAAVLEILLAITLASNPALSVAGGSDFYNTIALASNPAVAAVVFKAAFPSLSLASVPALSITVQADLLADILAATFPEFLAVCGFDFIEALILASAGALMVEFEWLSGPKITVGAKLAAIAMARRGPEAAKKQAPGALRRES